LLLLVEPLSAEVSRQLTAQLLHLGASGVSAATLHISSPGYGTDAQGAQQGGDLEWLPVAALLLQHRAAAAAAAAAGSSSSRRQQQQQQQLTVTTIALGHAGGPAALLLACGAAGRRFATRNT
ncbi:hypothetical protein, conserved, partial [Eimeria tenella]